MKNLILHATAFIAGFAIMALELLGFRVLAPYFGYSIYVSGSLIGIVLAALSIGYVTGGRIADRNSRLEILWGITMAGGVLTFLSGLLHGRVLGWLGSMGAVNGALVASVLLFGPPMLLLSMVSPFIIRVVSKEATIGRSAGNIYGVATVGSIAGVFLTSFVLIPNAGGTTTFHMAGAVLLIVSIIGFAASGRYFAFAGVVFFGFLLVPGPEPEAGVLVEKESMYTRLYVVEEKGRRRLSVCRDLWLWSFDAGPTNLTGEAFDYFLLGPMVNASAREVLVLGMGAGTSIKQMCHFFPNIEHIDAVEIDPEVVRLAEEYFDLRPSERLSIHVADARVFLSQTNKKYDFIEIDLFHQGPHIPFYVATREFFTLLRNHLKEEGLIVYNVLAPDGDFALADAIGVTMKSVMPDVFSLQVPLHGKMTPNLVLVGMNYREGLDRLKETIFNYPDNALQECAAVFFRGITRFQVPEGGRVLTDDRSNIEMLNFEVVSRYLEKWRAGNGQER